MALKTEGKHAGEFIVSEANGTRSRGVVTVVSGQNLVAGAVVGKITASGKYKEYDNGASDGSEVAAAILFDNVDATSGDKSGVVLVRDCEVNAAELTWKSGQSGADITAGKADLAALGIIAR